MTVASLEIDRGAALRAFWIFHSLVFATGFLGAAWAAGGFEVGAGAVVPCAKAEAPSATRLNTIAACFMVLLLCSSGSIIESNSWGQENFAPPASCLRLSTWSPRLLKNPAPKRS